MDYFEHLKKIHDVKLHRENLIKEKTELCRKIMMIMAWLGVLILFSVVGICIAFVHKQIPIDIGMPIVVGYIVFGMVFLFLALLGFIGYGFAEEEAIKYFENNFIEEAKIIKEDEEFQATLKKLNALKK
jgi:uncharacterized BrkB/YihY/UPF0761 family membrane protein